MMLKGSCEWDAMEEVARDGSQAKGTPWMDVDWDWNWGGDGGCRWVRMTTTANPEFVK